MVFPDFFFSMFTVGIKKKKKKTTGMYLLSLSSLTFLSSYCLICGYNGFLGHMRT
jgi:hypothetical protein